MANQPMGSSFDDFLADEGLLEECKEEAAKKIFIWLLEKEMQQHLYVETSCTNEKEEDKSSSHS